MDIQFFAGTGEKISDEKLNHMNRLLGTFDKKEMIGLNKSDFEILSNGFVMKWCPNCGHHYKNTI